MKKLNRKLFTYILISLLAWATPAIAATVYTGIANIFTANQRINAALGINVAPGATGTLSLSGGIFERSRSTAMGDVTSVAYSAGNFTANGSMVWTVASGDQTNYSYILVGKIIFIDITLDTTTVSGTLSNILSIAIPGGFIAAKPKQTPCIIFDNSGSVFEIGLARVVGSGTTVDILRPGLVNFSASTDATHLRIGMNFEVQ